VLYAYEAEIERELADGGRLAGIRDWASKAAGQAVRLAGLVEVADRVAERGPLCDPIGAWAMEAGVRLVRALTTHARPVYAGAALGDPTATLQFVLSRAIGLPPGSKLRDLHEKTRERQGLTTMADMRPVVAELEERNCLKVHKRLTGRRGRPTEIFEVHPALREPETDPQNPQKPRK
jgi:hypothetical protein